ncbi:MAG: recombinase family protein [Calothrix sp. SM1_5_4]|nr:recombinase family protein [Calothrix sp. SM1_5_4]
MRKIGIVCRVSTEEQAQTLEGSIKNQGIECRRYVEQENERHGGQWGKVVNEYIDEGFSGKNLNRPAIKRALQDLEDGVIDTILVTCLTRFSRNKRDWYRVLDHFKDRGILFISIRQKIDLSSAMGRAMFGMMIEFGQLEREQTVEKVELSIFERKSAVSITVGPCLSLWRLLIKRDICR